MGHGPTKRSRSIPVGIGIPAGPVEEAQEELYKELASALSEEGYEVTLFARPSIGGPGGDVLIQLGEHVGRDALDVLTSILVAKLAGKVTRGLHRDRPRTVNILGPDWEVLSTVEVPAE